MDAEKIELKLYIIEKLPGNTEMVNKLNAFLNEKFDSCFKLDVIDILNNPGKTYDDDILASPTLIRVKPLPSKRIVGSIKHKDLEDKLELFKCL